MDDRRRSTFVLLSLISGLNLLTLVLVFTHRIHSFSDFRLMSLLTMAIAIAAAWFFNFREWRRALPASESDLYKKLANTILALGIFVNLAVQAGTGLLMHR
jgi:hypothetical protein